MSIVTITTDFGVADFSAGLLAGVVWRIAPDAEVVPLTHDIPRHDVAAGARLLERALAFFPAGTVHVMVIDPGVGTQRRSIAARLGNQYFVGPDNGLITLTVQRLTQEGQSLETVSLDRPQYWLADVSSIFHGRDIFTPIGAHLARGVPLQQVGTPIDDPLRFEFPRPMSLPGGITGQVVQVDHFGNLSSNVPAALLPRNMPLAVTISGQAIQGLAHTFGEGQPGDLLALIDSSGYLAICVVNGNAAQFLGVAEGTALSVDWPEATSKELT